MTGAGLLLAWHPRGLGAAARDAFERVAADVPARVHALPATDLEGGERLRARIWAREPGGGVATDPGGSFLALLGNPTRPGASRPPAPAALLAEAQAGAPAVDALSPPFAAVLSDARDDTVLVAVDRCGLQHLYAAEARDGTVWIASSLLPLARELGASVDADAAAEWLAAGHFVSERTLARGVRKLGAGERLRLGAGGVRTLARWRPGDERPPTGDDAYREALLCAIRAAHASGAPAAAELTGGLDSRLVLAGRLRAGVPALSWTLGDPASAEVRTVRRLQAAVGFEHVAVDVRTPEIDLPALVLELHELADGEVSALEYAPLLVAFDALDGFREVSVSGAGGEIARGFYFGALDRHGGVDAGALVGKLSRAAAPAAAALRPDVFPEPLGPLRRAAEGVLESSRAAGGAGRLEDFYVRARMQRFAGRNVTTTGVFCRQGLPYFDDRVVDASLALPTARKVQGRVVREAIAAWAPKLARIPLDSGIAVAPRAWTAPAPTARWAAAMGRKALARFGGAAGRRAAALPPPPVGWGALRTDPAFTTFVRDLLPSAGARVHELLDPAATTRLVDRALAGGDLYPLGLVLTLELTLRRLSAPPPRTAPA